MKRHITPDCCCSVRGMLDILSLVFMYSVVLNGKLYDISLALYTICFSSVVNISGSRTDRYLGDCMC